MKKTFLLIWVLNIMLLTSAQSNEAKKILDEVSTKTRSWKTLSADFIYSLENKEMNIHESNEGAIWMKSEKYSVSLPGIGWRIFSDGETVWNYMEEGNQVTISNIEDGESELMNPSNLLTIYEKGFRSELAGEKMIGNISCFEIELYPDSPQYEVNKIIIYIGKADKMIKSARLFSTDGNLYGIDVKKMIANADFPETYLVFNPQEYTDIEIIDFR
ncbi:MAG: outer membrane lipoprotein carrier protein LolA [Mariniphaga sp.]|nr:outer membrane lipoprotein carrier protein LolA [Mariniphaga sp.]